MSAAYGEGQSSLSSEVCATPMGPFQVSPTSINFDLLEDGEYQESFFQLANTIVLMQNFLLVLVNFLILIQLRLFPYQHLKMDLLVILQMLIVQMGNGL